MRGYADDRFWGNNLFLLNAELRLPFDKGGTLNGALFVDVGDAWGGSEVNREDIKDFKQHGSFKPNVGFGFGIRVKTPVGPVRLDYGIGETGSNATSLSVKRSKIRKSRRKEERIGNEIPSFCSLSWTLLNKDSRDAGISVTRYPPNSVIGFVYLEKLYMKTGLPKNMKILTPFLAVAALLLTASAGIAQDKTAPKISRFRSCRNAEGLRRVQAASGIDHRFQCTAGGLQYRSSASLDRFGAISE